MVADTTEAMDAVLVEELVAGVELVELVELVEQEDSVEAPQW